MLTIRDPVGNEAPLKATQVAVTDNLGEIGQLSFVVNASDISTYGVQLIGARTVVTVPETNQMYRISNMSSVSVGNFNQITVTATHIASDLHDKFIDENAATGSKTLDDCMKIITADSKFKYTIHDKFDKFDFTDAFGGGYADDLFINTLAEDFGFEFSFNNYQIDIYKTVGKSNAFVFVDGLNIAKINKTEDYTNIQTYIKGTGKDPNADSDDSDDNSNDDSGGGDDTNPNGKWISPVGTGGHFMNGQLFGDTAGRGNVHDGLDFGSLMGWSHKIVAPHDSKIVYVGYDQSWAHGMIVGVTGNLWWLCQEYSNVWTADTFVKVGQMVKAGDHIANMTNDHLHFGMTKEGLATAIEGSNTTAGFIDPRPYLGV
ncbi:phage tail spike protein [Pediococcus pentosaceus]|uniref:phage tail spike protein n=1 Tax=Pediococcus pentosaceus TaxID=1255 RepID=UPI00223B17EF|nr:phage tail spike protein [Pediococcus pentosaceus]